MNLNKAIILGRLTADPEERTLPSGQTVASFGLATNRVWSDKDGNRQESTEYHNVVLFGRLAEIASRYLAKGRMCLVVGRIQTRSWEDQNGNKRYRTEIIGEELQLGPRPQGELGLEGEGIVPSQEPKKKKAKKEEEKELEESDEGEVDVEDIPF